MPRSQRNDNFINFHNSSGYFDTNSTYYTTKREGEASIYYKDGAIREERRFRKALFPINWRKQFEKPTFGKGDCQTNPSVAYPQLMQPRKLRFPSPADLGIKQAGG